MPRPDRPAHILVVANRTAVSADLLRAVRTRARRQPATFHLLVPAEPHGLHRVVDPEVAGRAESEARLDAALPQLREAAAGPVSGHVGSADPAAAISDALLAGDFDEIIISTLPWTVSRWLRLDLPARARAFGLPVTHVQARLHRGGRRSRGDQDAQLHAPSETRRSAVIRA